jgi:hypothetical protein
MYRVSERSVPLQESGQSRARPKLKELVFEASRALARLDVPRLEELALCCQALNRDLVLEDLAQADGETRKMLAFESREAVGDMAVFARVLEATRANLHVMQRLRELREGSLGYGLPPAPRWRRTESGHGDN